MGNLTHPDILRAEREGGPVGGVWPSEQRPTKLRCNACGELVNKLYACNFCNRAICFTCYSGAAAEVKGGLNVRDTSWNCCYKCAEIDEVQIVILQAAKSDAEAQLKRAEKQYHEKADGLAAVIDGINEELKTYE